MQADFRPAELFDLSAEYGRGWVQEEGSPAEDDAWRIRFRGGGWRGVSYYLEKVRAGSDYAGFYSDVDFTRASIYFPAGSKLRLRASYAHDRSNLEFNPSLTNAPREERYRLGIDYRPVSATRLSLDYECQQRRDLLAPSSFDDEADRFAFSVVQSLRSLSFRSSAGLLRVRDRLGDAETDRLAYRVDAIWVPSDWQRYSAFFSHGHEGLTADPDLERSAGINARLSLGDRLQVDLQMEMRGLGGEDPATTQLVGDLAYVLRHGHTLSAEARPRAFAARRQTSSLRGT